MSRLRLLPGFLLLLPSIAHAQRMLAVSVGTSRTVEQVLSAIINFMAGAVVFVVTAMVAVGALYIVLSRGESEMVTKGKHLIVGSLIGAAVVLGAYAVLRTVFFFVYS